MIADLKAGQKITDFFVLRHKEIRTKKDSDEIYLALELGDASGRIFGSYWGDASAVESCLNAGTLVKIRATVIEWHNQHHLSIDKSRSANDDDNISLELFLPHAKEPLSSLLEDYDAFIKQIKNRHLKQLFKKLLNDSDFKRLLQKAPGGKLWHHCYLGGLLEHSNSVARLVCALSENYEHMNRDLLLAGALLHDVGKVQEYKWHGYIDFSDAGRLQGHIAIGYHIVAPCIDSIRDFPDSLRNELLHLVLSHQGQKEHGSPIPPMTREAIILNYADEIDSKLGAFERIYEKEKAPDKAWSNYVKLLDRFLYFGRPGKMP